jgi:hypothetical protein
MRTPDQLAGELTRGLDGPHADESTTGAACLAYEAVRFLNYATGSHSGSGLTEPATVYAVAASLSAVAYGLPQMCRQLAAWLDAEHAAGRLADDENRPVADLINQAWLHLSQATRAAGSLGDALAQAQSVLSGLHPSRGEAR